MDADDAKKMMRTFEGCELKWGKLYYW
jgi:hypothetical protein